MSQYKRSYQKGGTYFFTVVTYNRYPIFTNSKNIELFKNSIKKVKSKYPFSLNAIEFEIVSS